AGQIIYLIYQSNTAGGETYNQESYVGAAGTTQYLVKGLDARTSYSFVVRARDLSGNTDVNKHELSATTGDISFKDQVQSVFNLCWGCHGGATPQQGLSLADAATSYMSLVNHLSSECTGNELVLPGQPDQSYLVWKLQGMGPCFMGGQMAGGAGDLN